MSSLQDTFGCPQCGQQFIWTAEHAGRKLACGCGQVLTVPAHPPDAPQEYGLADEPESPPAGAPLPVEPVMPANPPQPAPVLAYDARHARHKFALGEGFWDRLRDLWLPVGLIGLSTIVITISCAWVLWNTAASKPQLLASVSIRLGWDVMITMIVGTFLAWLLDTGLGEVPTALLKLSAIAMARFAIWAIFGLTSRSVVGDMVGFLLSLPPLLFLISYLFELDFRDTFFAVCLLTLVRWVSYFGMWKLLP
jgi:hypothetical protein